MIYQEINQDIKQDISENLASSISKKLETHKNKNLYRKRIVCEDNLIDFSSNDYLGLSSHTKILSCLKSDDINSYGAKASSYISGYSKHHKQCEDFFSQTFGFDGALLFGSGFAANIGVIKALADKNTLVFQDKLNHASLIDGALASDGKLIRYKHLDLQDLENKIVKNKAKYQTQSGIIATDIVFSMDGDIANINEIIKIAEINNYPVIFDEAHSVGVLGEKGLGLVYDFLNKNNNKQIRENTIIICPLGKAFGSYGAVVLANGVYLEAIEQFSRTLIYSTALPPVCANISKLALKIILSEGDKLRSNLNKNINYFIKRAMDYNLPIIRNSSQNKSAVQGLLLGDANLALDLSNYLKNKKFHVVAIRAPTVLTGFERLRITIRSAHTFLQIDNLLSSICEYFVINKININKSNIN